jgi:3',5'-cyclic AMP phosphodiesterase CpdA
MALLLHLSDLHIDARSSAQRTLFDLLVETVGREKDASGLPPAALVITGDVFDSGTFRPDDAVPIFLDLHARIVAAIGSRVPTIVLPGNHDRRWRGLVGPHRPALFEALRERADPRSIYVAGCQTPFLAEVVPPSFHGLTADVVAYDSTYLPTGWVSAGGVIRQEDLLQAHAQIDAGAPARPLLLLVHHHLIPTPLTDVSFIDTRGPMPALLRWLLGRVLPYVVSNADREELTMTALGAGTALSTLHSLGRAVLLLHGHKHFPTARLVRGIVHGAGDVLLASAGSGGKRERVQATQDPEAARLWPSFNAVHLLGERLEVESVSFAPRPSASSPVRRDLVKATRQGTRWDADTVSARVQGGAIPVERDEARFVLSPSRTSSQHWDFVCERRVRLVPHATIRRYVEFVYGGAQVTPAARARRRIELDVQGEVRYEVSRGLRRTVAAPVRVRGMSTAFEWVGLLVRYGAATASLSLARDHADGFVPFGSVTDLGTAREQPASVEASVSGWTVSVRDCPARTMLRIYWPLH